MRVFGSFPVGFLGLMGNKRQFSDRVRELLGVFESLIGCLGKFCDGHVMESM